MSATPSPAPSDDGGDPTLPRILCLHGGATNALIFKTQCRAIISALKHRFRFVFVDAPFPCAPHPDIVPVYGDLAPFYRWLRFIPGEHDDPEHGEDDPRWFADRVLFSIRKGITSDGGTGEIVGVMGFSQGAKIAASLLWAVQHLEPYGTKVEDMTLLERIGADIRRILPALEDLKFGVIVAGSAPVVMLDPVVLGVMQTKAAGQQKGAVNGSALKFDGFIPRHVESPASLSQTFKDWPTEEGTKETMDGQVADHVIALPTLHVHGLRDPGIDRHRKLLRLYCKKGTTRHIEWDGGHRIPIKTSDVKLMVDKILEMAEETGAFLDVAG